MIYSRNGDAVSTYTINNSKTNTVYDVHGDQIGTDSPKDPYLPNRLLLFEDDFNGSELNSESWFCEAGYLRGDDLHQKANVKVENSNLVVTSKRDAISTSGWTLGEINGSGCRSWMYGRFEAKIKCDGVKGSWPAFWCLADAHFGVKENLSNEDGTVEYPRQVEGDTGTVTCPLSGEIDIVEIWHQNWSVDNVGPCATLYSTNQTPSVSLGGQTFPSAIDSTQYHIYAMEWTPNYIEAFVDNIPYKRWTFSDFNQELITGYITYPFSMLLGVGQLGSEPATNEHWMMVDWVRVYAPEGTTQEIPVQSVSILSTFRLKKGYKKYMVGQVTPKNATNRHLRWYSTDESVVKVEHGLMYGIDYGTATIIAASDNGKLAMCTVTVVDEY